MKKNIITIGGSNSKTSITKALAEYTGRLMSDIEITNIDLNDFEMEMYSIDVENEKGHPVGAKDLNAIFDKADGFVICLAEHNGVYSVAFKNVLDWLSRLENKVWRNVPMLLLSATPGERGGITLLNIAKDRFPYLGANIIGSMAFPSFYDNFKEGEVINAELKEELQSLVSEFAEAI